MAESTWLTREVPILEAVAAAEMAAEMVDSMTLAERSGLANSEAAIAVRALIDGGYIDANEEGGLSDPFGYFMGVHLRERGRRYLGSWPKDSQDGLDTFLELLAERIDTEPDEEEKSRLRRLRDAAQGVSRDVGTALLVAWLKSVTGIPG
jgi:DNA-binding IclR family transcriptional regulator